MDQVQARAQIQVDYKEQAVEDQQEVVVEDVAEDPKAHDGFSILIESEQPKCLPIQATSLSLSPVQPAPFPLTQRYREIYRGM